MQVDFTQFNCQLNNTNLNYFQIKYCGMTMRKTAKGLSNIDVLITKFWQHIYSSMYPKVKLILLCTNVVVNNQVLLTLIKILKFFFGVY